MYILISKSPEGSMDRCNKIVEGIRRKHKKEQDLLDLIQFVEHEMNDPLFTREILHEYKKDPEKYNERKIKQMKRCLTKAENKKDPDNGSVQNPSVKCYLQDGNRDLNDN